MLTAVLPAEIFSLLLVFVRVGAAIMVMPGIGDPYVAPRIRLFFALMLAIVVAPVVRPVLPALPESVVSLGLLLMGEIVIGLFLGGLARLIMAALTTAGMVIAYMSSLANALVDDPSAAQQGSIAGSFLAIVAILTIFTLDLHHMLLRGVVDSYALFLPGEALPVGDFAEMVTRVVSQSFLLSFQIAAPFVAVGLIFYLGIGLLSRLMPQVQIFFIALPLQITAGLAVLFFALPVAIVWFLNSFEQTLRPFTAGG